MSIAKSESTWIPELVDNRQLSTDEKQQESPIYRFHTPITGQADPNRNKDIKPPVQPLYDEETIERAKKYLLHKECRYQANYLRDYALFVLGINIGRRYCDLAQLQIQDVANEDRSIKDRVKLTESKTGKHVDIILNTSVKEALVLYLNTKAEHHMQDYLFPNYKTGKPLSRDGYYKIMKRMEKELELSYPIGTHTMRKTCGTQMVLNAPKELRPEVEYYVSKMLYKHSTMNQTKRYLGGDQEIMDQLVLHNNYKLETRLARSENPCYTGIRTI